MRNLANAVQSQGRGDDTMLVHMTPREVGGLQALAMANGGSLTINPQTGLPEAGFLDNILPTILGIAGTALFPMAAPWMIGAGVGGIEALRTGDIGKGLMAGLGAFGGANLGSALSSAGAAAPTTVASQLGVPGAASGVGSQAAMLAEQGAEFGLGNLEAIRAGASQVVPQAAMSAAPSAYSAMGTGISNLGTEAGRSALGSALSNQFGSMSTGEKIATGLGAANTFGAFEQPAMQPLVTPEEESDYAGPYLPTKRAVTYPGADRRSTSEFSYFSPSNPIPYAEGGDVNMEDGGFVVDARTVSEIGNGSSNAGLERLASIGARPIQGRGDGVSDSIPANIGGSQAARVARDEAYLPPEAVKRAGGATKLYAMMDKAHKARKSAKRGENTGGLKALMA